MLQVFEEIGIEAAMIIATIVATACFLYLVAVTVLERQELRRRRVAGLDRRIRIAFAAGLRPERPASHPERSAGQHA